MGRSVRGQNLFEFHHPHPGEMSAVVLGAFDRSAISGLLQVSFLPFFSGFTFL